MFGNQQEEFKVIGAETLVKLAVQLNKVIGAHSVYKLEHVAYDAKKKWWEALVWVSAEITADEAKNGE